MSLPNPGIAIPCAGQIVRRRNKNSRVVKKLRLADTYVLHRASGLIPVNMIGKDLEEKDPGKADFGQRLEKFAKADTWFSVSSFVEHTIAVILWCFL